MSTFKSSTNLQTLKPLQTKSVAFATSSSSNPSESLPSEQRWWAQKFHLGPSKLFPKKKSTRATSTTFQTPTAGSAIISHVSFAPNAIKGHPYQMAVVSGPRVCLYGGTASSSLARGLARVSKTDEDEDSLFGREDKSVKPDRTVTTGGQPAHFASYHTDGRLLAIGCDHGLIKICDSQTRATLRTFSTHKSGGFPIRSVGWMPEDKKGQRMVWSAGDDAMVRIWDLSGDMAGIGDTAKPVFSLRGHGDAIRATVGFKLNGKICIASGSYDHTIRIWDCDGMSKDEIDEHGDRCHSIMDHGDPVEALLVINPSDSSLFQSPLLLSAGGTTVKLWDPQLGACLTTLRTKHSKTITSISLVSVMRSSDEDSDDGESNQVIKKRLITAGLDGLIRIHSADQLFENSALKDKKMKKPSWTFPYLHGVRTSEPITALAMSPDSTRFIFGTSSGLVTVRQRAKFVFQGVKRKSTYEPKAGTYSYFMRGMGSEADADDHILMLQKKKKLKKYDMMLQKFRYGDALDEALSSRDPNGILAVLEELGRRRGLMIALSNRDEETLEPLLAFTASFISNPRYTPVLVGVANQLCDIYSHVFGQSETIDEYFQKLHVQVKNECNTQSALNQLIGQIDAVMYTAEIIESND
jgi:U3 small nucleolar RNA-associated protein 15